MDVKRGHCWRCEEPIVSNLTCTCPHCKISIYCSKKCKEEDQYRHKPECEVWGPKKCNNSSCSKAERLKECSGCNDAWYCSEACQRQDRVNHKKQCQKHIKSVITSASKKRDYFQKRSGGPFSRPYYIGNHIAIDMLNLQDNECQEKMDSDQRKINLQQDLAILSIGCSNLRNTIKTTTSLPDDFTGKLHITLNDFDPFVQARNILFLFMIIAHASVPDLPIMLTTIWYSIHLSEREFNFLTHCLQVVVRMTASAIKDNTNGLVRVADDCMPQIREVWRGWIDVSHDCRKDSAKYINIQRQRQVFTEADERVLKWKALFQRQVSKDCAKSVELWYNNGNFFASSTSNKESYEYDNPTLTGYFFRMNIGTKMRYYNLEEAQHLMKSPRLSEFVYCIPPNLSAFNEWDQLSVERHSSGKSLIVMFHSYITSLIAKTIALFKEKRLYIAVDVSNCFEMPSRLTAGQQFDRILTSNLADYHGTQIILKTFKPLLKAANKHAVIITQYVNWYQADGPYGAQLEFNAEAAVDGTYKKCLIAAKNDTGRQDVGDMLKFGGALRGNSQFMLMDDPNVADPQSVIDAMSKMGLDEYLVQEYFNSTNHFICLLRADLMASDKSLPTDKAVPFQKVLRMEGLQMRDFRRGLNKVVPFAFRRNARPVNLLRGLERMVEWHLQEEQ